MDRLFAVKTPGGRVLQAASECSGDAWHFLWCYLKVSEPRAEWHQRFRSHASGPFIARARRENWRVVEAELVEVKFPHSRRGLGRIEAARLRAVAAHGGQG